MLAHLYLYLSMEPFLNQFSYLKGFFYILILLNFISIQDKISGIMFMFMKHSFNTKDKTYAKRLECW